MIFRFSLYGFLKNQQYYDPFIILAFRAMILSALGDEALVYTYIGLLIGLRELAVNLLEIPTGAIADVVGRRRAMICSHVAYIGAFMLFGLAEADWGFGAMYATLLAGMAMFAVGEAFRTGTHKAIVFDWVDRAGLADQRTGVYGVTRAWARVGSAVSVIIAAALVFFWGRRDFSLVFYITVIPYAANIVLFTSYPAWLDGEGARERPSLGRIFTVLFTTLGRCLRSPRLRRLLAESMTIEGSFKVSRDYLQPVIRSAVLAAPLLAGYSDRQRTAVLVGAVYFALHLGSSYASLRSAAVAKAAGGEDRGARWLWWAHLAGFALIAVSGAFGGAAYAAAIAAFVALSILQNFWRPIQLSRFSDAAGSEQRATVLSAESQAKSLFAAAAAPLLGLAVDLVGQWHAESRFLPVGLLGVAAAVAMLALSRPTDEPAR